MAVSCDDARSAYLERNVTPEIEAHAAGCPRCGFLRDMQRGLGDADTGVADTGAVEPAPAAAEARHGLPHAAAGRYQVGQEIGRGGLGRVLRARDAVLDREIAIKEILGGDDASRRRFVREALITARLQHPAIVPVYEAAQWGERAPFYAMKLVAGRPLSEAIAGATTLAARLALVPTVLTVADAIAYAHAEHIIHRDLKPANVMVGAFGETVVIDWGLAKDLSIDDRDAPDAGPYREAASDRTAAGVVLGTPAYMSPEQAAREEVDERADVYSIGAMLYHVVSGQVPHQGATRDEMIARVITGQITPLAAREPQAPADLAAVVTKAMALAPADRYPSARELAADLRRFLSGQLVAVHRYSLRELVRRWAGRHRVALMVSAVAAVVLLGYGTWSVRRIVGESRRADAARDRAVASAREAAGERDHAVAQANRAVLAQARTVLAAGDAGEALRLLTTLSPAGPGWDAARVIAADARSRPRVVATALLRQNARAPIEISKWTVDAAHGRAFFWSWGDLWIVELATGALSTVSVAGPVWPDTMVACDDGARLVGWNAGGGDVRIVELELGKAAPAERALDETAAVAFLTACRGDLARIPDPGALAGRFPDATLVAASNDGRVIVLRGSEHDLAVRAGEPPIELPFRGMAWTVAPDGSWLAGATAERVMLLRGPGFERDDVLLVESVEALDVSADGRWLIARGAHTYAWNMEAGAWMQTMGGQPPVAAAWAGGDRVVTRDGFGTVQVWSLSAPQLLVRDAGYLAASPDAGWIVDESDAGLRRTDASGGSAVATTAWPVPKPIAANLLLREGAVSPGGDVIILIDGAVWVWRRGGRWERLGDAPEGGARGEPSVGWTRAGAPMVWADHEIITWEQGQARRIEPFEAPAVRRLLAVRDDLALAAALDTLDGGVVLVDLARRTEVALPGAAGASNHDRVGFSGDGGRLITGASDEAFDGHLVWDVVTRESRPIPRGDADPASIEISRDGRRVATGGPSSVALIDVADGARRVVASPSGGRGLALDGTGARVLIGGLDGARLWDVGAAEGRHLVIGDPRWLHLGPAGATVQTSRGVYRFADDLPAEPCALLAALGAPCKD